MPPSSCLSAKAAASSGSRTPINPRSIACCRCRSPSGFSPMRFAACHWPPGGWRTRTSSHDRHRAAMPKQVARITPIAAHPKFALEIGTTFDPKAVEALRGLGGGVAFLRELIDSFRDDAELLLQRLNNALAAADAAGFAQGVAELRRCAGHLGGRRICEMLPAPADVTEAELRGAGALLLQRLPAEIDRLIAALQGCLVAKQAQRS